MTHHDASGDKVCRAGFAGVVVQTLPGRYHRDHGSDGISASGSIPFAAILISVNRRLCCAITAHNRFLHCCRCHFNRFLAAAAAAAARRGTESRA
jgi:hypothetical protein